MNTGFLGCTVPRTPPICTTLVTPQRSVYIQKWGYKPLKKPKLHSFLNASSTLTSLTRLPAMNRSHGSTADPTNTSKIESYYKTSTRGTVYITSASLAGRYVTLQSNYNSTVSSGGIDINPTTRWRCVSFLTRWLFRVSTEI